jgi:hypothetical protein
LLVTKSIFSAAALLSIVLFAFTGCASPTEAEGDDEPVSVEIADEGVEAQADQRTYTGGRF